MQKEFTRVLPGLEDMDYEERLNKLGLFSLERRRMRRNLIEVYKIMTGLDRVDSQSLFPGSITQGHRLKMRGRKFKRDARGKFFTQRMVNAWNALPEEVVEADSMTMFKRHLDRYMNRQGIGGYGARRGKKILD